ncbi:MAG: ABC transporter substrate-binding protein [Acidobacteria bacterium]|nr:MAG: ABC transporter substrate-binding protein [Acidobacteriota bacterium]REK01462.1 MAG: ABC transporter substrate-binding protein [Acidobacteriota bacterium]REK14418.1 MAG: ABC transporter substrate-binding protein [Acidobacteriota bacterium]REK45133.1 MAG: ABC transporter substrate-binding protein [Acidobacteriota bacterium]
MKRVFTFIGLIVLGLAVTASTCSRRDVFTIAMDGKFSTLDPIGSITVDANSERIRTLIYNSLVRKNEKFEYVGDLAESIEPSEDGLAFTFKLREGVNFQDGKPLSSEDVKYTFDKLFESEGAKASAFSITEEGNKVDIITAIETPDERTVVIKIARPEFKNQLLPNLVPIAVIPKDAAVGKDSGANTNPPIGTGPYKFVSFDTAQNVVELEAFDGYWEGAPNVKQIRLMVLADANALQAELLSGRVNLAPGASSLPPDSLTDIDDNPSLKVVKVPGSNIQYLWFNTQAEPVNEKAVRQAVAYAVNRERLINDVLAGSATMAYSILPEQSWAYEPGTRYDHDLEKARSLLDEAGIKDTNGDGLREMKPVILKISSSSRTVQQYSQVIQNQLKEAGIPLEIESLEPQTMRSQVQGGQFIMTTGIWVGGNSDPIFLKDLFASSNIPVPDRVGLNRGRYENEKVDELLEQAFKERDQQKAKELYAEAQKIISEEIPLIPLWYPNNIIIASEGVENIAMNASGDWDFIRKITYAGN